MVPSQCHVSADHLHCREHGGAVYSPQTAAPTGEQSPRASGRRSRAWRENAATSVHACHSSERYASRKHVASSRGSWATQVLVSGQPAACWSRLAAAAPAERSRLL